jgi:hypothetical protein
LFEKEFVLEGIKCSIFFSRPPKVTLAFEFLEASSPFEEYSLCSCMQEKNEGWRKFFLVSHSYFGTRRLAPEEAAMTRVRRIARRFCSLLAADRL